MSGMRFSITENRWKKALLRGMEIDAAGRIVCCSSGRERFFILPLLDSGMEGCQWGRLRFVLQTGKNGVCRLHAAAGNDRETLQFLSEKRSGTVGEKGYPENMPCMCFVNQPDVLLYGLEGRYLWIAGEIDGDSVCLWDMSVEMPGDNFLRIFPEIYRERGSFFHRYLSVYSSVYNDFQEQITHRERMLDGNHAPPALLELYLQWLGIDVKGGFLEENVLRRLLSEAGRLLRRKGTRDSIARICRIVAGETPVIVEKSRMRPYGSAGGQAVYDMLFGSSPYDVTLLFSVRMEERKKRQLLYLLAQFQPVRCRLRIVFLERRGRLDSHSYLDRNAVIPVQTGGCLDREQALDQTVILQ